MIVTEISEISKTRCRIEIDHQFAFVLYKGELCQYQVREGEEITKEDYREIMEEVLPRRAKLRCMNLLQSREYTEAQLREKLRQGMYPREIEDQAIAYVASFRYIDDLRYAEDYIRAHEDSRSKFRIERDLVVKGISGEIIEQAWCNWEAKGGAQDEMAMIRSLLTKKHYDPDTADYKEKQRIYAYLARRGYSSEQIRRAMRTED